MEMDIHDRPNDPTVPQGKLALYSFYQCKSYANTSLSGNCDPQTPTVGDRYHRRPLTKDYSVEKYYPTGLNLNHEFYFF